MTQHGFDPETQTIERDVTAQPLRVSDWGVATSVGQIRTTNEDAWAEMQRHWFLVADGMGGEAGGQLASHAAARSFMRRIGSGLSDWSDLLTHLNQDVHDALIAGSAPEGGTTVVGLHLGERQVSVAHIGDSRAYRLSTDSKLQALTVDHNVAEELLAAGESVEHYRHNIGRTDALTRYVGGGSPYPPTIGFPAVGSGDRVLLCTDGVHGQLGDDRIAGVLSAGSCQEAANGLVALSDQAGGRDNSTALVVQFAASAG